MLIDLPIETVVLVGGVVTALVGLVVKWVGGYVPWLAVFLEKYQTEWGVALSAALVLWIENSLPGAELAGISVMAVQLAVAVAVYALGKLGLASYGVRGFKQ